MALSQTDPRWADKKLGTSKFTVRDSGCYSFYCINALETYGKPITPAGFIDWMNNNGGYDGEGMLKWGAIEKLYPDCFLYGSTWTTNFPDANTQKTQIMKVIADVKRAVSMGFVVGLCVSIPENLGRPNHIVACDYAPNDLGEWMVLDSAYGDYVRFEERYGSVLTQLYGTRILIGPPIKFPTYSTPQDKNDGQSAWKASMIMRGKDANGTYARELLDNLMSGT